MRSNCAVSPLPSLSPSTTRSIIESCVQTSIPSMQVGDPGLAIFLMGLPGAGKTTVARKLDRQLRALGYRVTMLDGDDLRERLSPDLGFSRSDREANLKRAGMIASEVVKHGGIVICSFIAPYEKSRQEIREAVQKCGRFFLVYLSTPLEECERRDPKGLYHKARIGQIANFTGVSDPFENPVSFDLSLDTTDLTVTEAANSIVRGLVTNGVAAGLWPASAVEIVCGESWEDEKTLSTSPRRHQTRTPRLLPRIVRAMSDRRVSLKEVAHTIGVDRHSIERVVRLSTGLSFRGLQQSLLLERATLLLRRGSPLKEIAFELGFGSPQSFHRFIKRISGRTPTSLHYSK